MTLEDELKCSPQTPDTEVGPSKYTCRVPEIKPDEDGLRPWGNDMQKVDGNRIIKVVRKWLLQEHIFLKP